MDKLAFISGETFLYWICATANLPMSFMLTVTSVSWLPVILSKICVFRPAIFRFDDFLTFPA